MNDLHSLNLKTADGGVLQLIHRDGHPLAVYVAKGDTQICLDLPPADVRYVAEFFRTITGEDGMAYGGIPVTGNEPGA